MEDTNKLWNDFVGGKYELFISQVVTEEIQQCPEAKRAKLLEKMEQVQFVALERTDEVSKLAQAYIDNGVLGRKSIADCLHIAFAVVYDCDIIVSWNFKHLVNYTTVNRVKIVNAINRYKEISIIPPSMLLEEVDRE
jgi:predicted nucleic acid-binding protein